jgi:hypothetical protein
MLLKGSRVFEALKGEPLSVQRSHLRHEIESPVTQDQMRADALGEYAVLV